MLVETGIALSSRLADLATVTRAAISMATTESVFMKETLAPPVVEFARSNHRFLTEVRHAFLIRRPEEIAASFLALEGDCAAVGLPFVADAGYQAVV